MKPYCIDVYTASCASLSLSIPDTYFEVTSLIYEAPASGAGCYCIIYADLDDSIVQRHGPLVSDDLQFRPAAVTTLVPTASQTPP